MARVEHIDDGRSLIVELETVIQSGSTDRRLDTLRRITDLFVAEADRLNDQQIGMFDDVLNHLIRKIQGKALRELSRRLSPINNAPFGVVQRLAGDDDIAVAAPILTQSPRLNDSDFVEIASTKSQAHLLTISSRAASAQASPMSCCSAATAMSFTSSPRILARNSPRAVSRPW